MQLLGAVANGGTDFKENEEAISDYARSIGCQHLTVDGRMGWIKVLPTWTISSVTLNKTL
jgi:hypothetical protein